MAGPRGAAYAGTGAPEIARAAIETALSSRGLSITSRQDAPHRLRLEAEQQAPWPQVLRKALPQRSVWVVDSSDGRLLIAADFRLFRWYSALFALLWIASVAGLFGGTAILDRLEWSVGEYAFAGVLLLVGIGLVPLGIRMLSAFGSQTEPIWIEVMRDVEREGGRLQPVGLGLARRHTVVLFVFFLSVLFLGVRFFLHGQRGTSLEMPAISPAFNAGLGGLVVLLLAGLALMISRQGFNLRTYAVISGLLSMSAVFLALQAALLPWWMVSRVDLPALGARLPILGRMTSGICFVLALTAVYLASASVRAAGKATPQLRRVQDRREDGVYRAAAGAVPPWPFQVVFVLSWLVMAGLLWTSLGILALCAAQTVAPFSSRPELRLAEVSQVLIGAGLGRAGFEAFTRVAVSSGWIAAAAGGIGLLFVSTSQLVRRRRETRESLRERAAVPFPRREELERLLDEILSRRKRPPLKLAMKRGQAASAEYHSFGLWRSERFIELSEGCLSLSRKELTALLCHECAHDLQRHMKMEIALRWLGRLSFTGDGFVRAVLHSFGREMAADRIARELLGAPREGLQARLESQREDKAGPIPLPKNAASSESETWRAALSSFRGQYFGLGDHSLHYWHPDPQTRIDALLKMDRDDDGE